MGWGELAKAGAQVIGGNQQARAANDASNAQSQASTDSIKAGLAIYNQNRQDNYNNMVVGNSALNQLAKLYGLDYYDGTPSYDGITMTGGDVKVDKPSFLQRFNDPGGLWWSQSSSTTPMTFSTGGSGGGGGSGAPGNIQKGSGITDYSAFYMSPDYIVRQQEAMQGADRGAAARGRLYSGGFDADRMKLSADIGAQGFGDYRNSLLNMAGYGQQATSQVSQAGSQLGENTSSALSDLGRARASGYINQSNAWGNTVNGLVGTFGDWYGQRQANSAGGAGSSSSAMPSAWRNFGSSGPAGWW